jgi:MFS family permease
MPIPIHAIAAPAVAPFVPTQALQPAASVGPASIESRTSWMIATVVFMMMSVSFGSPYVVVVALTSIAGEVGGQRQIPALASSLAWLGAAVGGLAMSPLAERIGVRWTAIFGGIMICAGMALSSGGEVWQLYVGHGLLIGLLGNAGINAPLYIYVSQWFDRRRGTALALITSGQYVAGAFWPPVFERVMAAVGWRQTMWMYGFVVAAVVVPLAAIFFSRPPQPITAGPAGFGLSADGRRVLGMPANLVFGMLAAANFLCCVPMAMPSGHLIAHCGDLGMTAAKGAAMLSVLLGCAFVSRQAWGWLSDRIGALWTLFWSSAAQLAAMTAFVFTQDEIGLFTVAAFFGLGFSGLIPAYVLAIRELFPAKDASWRVPTTLLCGGTGMAVGGWLAGAIYDAAGFYGPAFATGVGLNMLHLSIVTVLVVQQTRTRGMI